MGRVRLELLHCAEHDCWALGVAAHGDETGSTRITRQKCCGRWTIVRHWNVDAEEAVNEIESCAEADAPGGPDAMGGTDA